MLVKRYFKIIINVVDCEDKFIGKQLSSRCCLWLKNIDCLSFVMLILRVLCQQFFLHLCDFNLQRPRRVGARFTGDDIKPDEHVQPQLSFDYDGKRDR